MVPNAYLVQMDHCHYFQNRRDDTYIKIYSKNLLKTILGLFVIMLN